MFSFRNGFDIVCGQGVYDQRFNLCSGGIQLKLLLWDNTGSRGCVWTGGVQAGCDDPNTAQNGNLHFGKKISVLTRESTRNGGKRHKKVVKRAFCHFGGRFRVKWCHTLGLYGSGKLGQFPFYS